MWDDLVVMKMITRPGDIKINHCTIYKKGDGIDLLLLDLQEKGCHICASGSDEGVPMIMISGLKGSQALSISFPEYKGWDLMNYHIGKYTCFMTMVKDDD